MRKLLVAILIVGLPLWVHANSETVTNRADLSSTTATSLTYVVSLSASNDTGASVPDLIGFFGSSDGGTITANWGLSTDLGTNYPGVLKTNTVYNLIPGKTYFYSVSANNESGAVWATSSAQGITGNGAGSATGNPLGIAASGASVTNFNLATLLLTNCVGTVSSSATSGMVAQANSLITALATTLTGLVNQVSILNSNAHRTGFP